MTRAVLGIIGGSGIYDLPGLEDVGEEVIESPWGEPSAALTRGVIAGLPRNVSIIFIEHDMNLVFRFAERITVLVGGAVLVEGSPEEIARDRRVREVYLGEAVYG